MFILRRSLWRYAEQPRVQNRRRGAINAVKAAGACSSSKAAGFAKAMRASTLRIPDRLANRVTAIAALSGGLIYFFTQVETGARRGRLTGTFCGFGGLGRCGVVTMSLSWWTGTWDGVSRILLHVVQPLQTAWMRLIDLGRHLAVFKTLCDHCRNRLTLIKLYVELGRRSSTWGITNTPSSRVGCYRQAFTWAYELSVIKPVLRSDDALCRAWRAPRRRPWRCSRELAVHCRSVWDDAPLLRQQRVAGSSPPSPPRRISFLDDRFHGVHDNRWRRLLNLEQGLASTISGVWGVHQDAACGVVTCHR